MMVICDDGVCNVRASDVHWRVWSACMNAGEGGREKDRKRERERNR